MKKIRILCALFIILLSLVVIAIPFYQKHQLSRIKAHSSYSGNLLDSAQRFHRTCIQNSYVSPVHDTFVIPYYTLTDIQKMPAHTLLAASSLNPELIPQLFYSTGITKDIELRMLGNSYVEDAKIALSELRYLRVLHYDIHGDIYTGELIVNKKIADSILDIMQKLFQNRYPIEKMVLIDAYGGDDTASMEDNNTSSFNYRMVTGAENLSHHSYGMAIDINPLYNPYVVKLEKSTYINPPSGTPYADRKQDFPYKITADDLCVQLFKSHGFGWGGDWESPKDYQHFEAYIPQN